MFALHQSMKVLVKLFQKLAGLGSAHKTAFSFCQAFSLRLSCQRKSGIVDYIVLSGRPQCILCYYTIHTLFSRLHQILSKQYLSHLCTHLCKRKNVYKSISKKSVFCQNRKNKVTKNKKYQKKFHFWKNNFKNLLTRGEKGCIMISLNRRRFGYKNDMIFSMK